MSDASNHPFGIPGGGPIGIPGAGPIGTGPSLTKTPLPSHGDPGGSHQPGTAFVLASWGARFGAALVDSIMRWLIAVAISLLGFLIFADHPFSTVDVDYGDGISNLGGIGTASLVIYFVIALLYAPISMVNMDGATPGKKLFGIRVVTETGAAPSFGEAFLREPIFKGVIVTLVGFSFFFVGWLLNYLWPLWDEQSRAGHDFMAHTRVIRAN